MNYFNYFSEIEDLFVRRRGKHLLLSPIDWAMMETWRERGIPLFIVLRGIETVFDTFDKNPGPRTIKGLMYCKEEIEAQFAEWSTLQAGSHRGNDEMMETVEMRETNGNGIEEILKHIERSAKTLRDHASASSLAEDIMRAAARLDELRESNSNDADMIERSLNDIENFLDNALLTNPDKLHLSNMEKAAAAELKPYKKGMDKEAYESTLRIVLLKKLREADNIPRLSLYYL